MSEMEEHSNFMAKGTCPQICETKNFLSNQKSSLLGAILELGFDMTTCLALLFLTDLCP